MNTDVRESIKESLRIEINLLKLYSIFLIVLGYGMGRITLDGSYDKSALIFGLYLFGIIAIITLLILFIVSIRKIYKKLNQLKVDI
jgi:hypothetical protein